ncbi:MAG: uroporphyrinogen-III synthase, partial [Candidatus Hydrothermarchaeaceae archaeon]
SASGAEIIHDYYGDELKKVKIAVIGPKTAEILRKRDIEVELVPREYKAESLAGELLAKGIKDKKILIARAAIGRKELVEMLEGEAKAEEVHLYDTKKPAEGGELKKFSIALRKGKIDAIIFTSSQAARNVLSMLGKNALLLNNIKVCAIGPVTACTLEKAGIRVDATPDKYTVQSCLDALEKIM